MVSRGWTVPCVQGLSLFSAQPGLLSLLTPSPSRKKPAVVTPFDGADAPGDGDGDGDTVAAHHAAPKLEQACEATAVHAKHVSIVLKPLPVKRAEELGCLPPSPRPETLGSLPPSKSAEDDGVLLPVSGDECQDAKVASSEQEDEYVAEDAAMQVMMGSNTTAVFQRAPHDAYAKDPQAFCVIAIDAAHEAAPIVAEKAAHTIQEKAIDASVLQPHDGGVFLLPYYNGDMEALLPSVAAAEVYIRMEEDNNLSMKGAICMLEENLLSSSPGGPSSDAVYDPGGQQSHHARTMHQIQKFHGEYQDGDAYEVAADHDATEKARAIQHYLLSPLRGRKWYCKVRVKINDIFLLMKIDPSTFNVRVKKKAELNIFFLLKSSLDPG